MDILLHIGAHRTGTASLQAYLAQNRVPLAALGLAVWGPEQLRGGMGCGLLVPVGQIAPGAVRRAARATGLLRLGAGRAELAGADRLIVSDPNLIGGVRDNLARLRLYPHAGLRLARFAPAFGGRCSRVALTIRAYDSYWASALALAVAHGAAPPDEARLDRLVTQPRRWRQVVADVAQVFPAAELVVWPFEALAGRPDWQLRAITGEPIPAQPQRPVRLNPAPGRDHLRRILQDRGGAAAQDAVAPGDGPWQPFGRHHVEVLRAQYAEDLAWLRNGADGLAILSDAPNADRSTPADAEPERHPGYGKEGRHHDGHHSGRGEAGLG